MIAPILTLPSMLRHIPILSALLVCTIAAPGESQNRPAGQPIGMVLQVQGQTEIRHAGSAATSARIADFHFAGDRVATGFGRATLLSCPLPETITLKEDTEVELGGEEAKTLRGQIISRVRVEICPVLRTALGSETLERVGGLRGRPGYSPIAVYLGGPVSTGRPTFEWAAVAAAKTFHLLLRKPDGTVLWDYRASSNRVSFPDTKPPLAEGSYEWELQAEADDKIVAAQTANFEIKLRGSAPQTNDAAPSLLRAVVLEQAGYYAEAAAEFRTLEKDNPSDSRIVRHLAWLYNNAGLIAAANDQMQKVNRQ